MTWDELFRSMTGEMSQFRRFSTCPGSKERKTSSTLLWGVCQKWASAIYVRTSAILQTTKLIAELRTKKMLQNWDCRPSKFDFRNSATFRSLLPVPLLSSPFSSAQDGFKNQRKIFLALSVSLETQKHALKGPQHEIFYLRFFFFINWPDSKAKNMSKIAEVKLSSCGLQKKFQLRNCGVAVVEQNFFKKLRNCECGSASFKLRNCDCRLQKKLHVPTSSICTVAGS